MLSTRSALFKFVVKAVLMIIGETVMSRPECKILIWLNLVQSRVRFFIFYIVYLRNKSPTGVVSCTSNKSTRSKSVFKRSVFTIKTIQPTPVRQRMHIILVRRDDANVVCLCQATWIAYSMHVKFYQVIEGQCNTNVRYNTLAWLSTLQV